AAVKLEITINSIIEVTNFKKGDVNLEKENVKWAEFVKKIVSGFKETLNSKEINCKINIHSDGKEMYVDRKQIKKVFKNILSNAVKFTGTGGTIEISSYRDGDNMKTSIKDSGIGMNENIKEKVFEGFTQAQDPLIRDNDGLGIGLTLVKYIVESHDGDIYIKSKSGQGTEVVFSLPDKNARPGKVPFRKEEK
ncbi:MAG: ATP-binding protein, partial [Elusimicrobiota bacterium]|nr:ATP-binding protein [Elusimicrobiota bacterium]